jgi:hypothetical protein
MSKYPRTYHFINSPGLQNDDRLQKDISNLIGTPIVIMEKLDGENCGFTKGGVYARSHATYAIKPWNVGVRQMHSYLGKDIPEDIYLFGENMEGIHSIEYNNLKSFFYLFTVKKNDIFLSWENVKEYAFLLDLEIAPILFEGIVNTEKELLTLVEKLSKGESKLGSYMKEGIVCRNQNEFNASEFSNNVVKYVRKDHVKTDVHWTKNWKRATINYE